MVDFPTTLFFLNLFASTPVVLFLAILGGRNLDHRFSSLHFLIFSYVCMSVIFDTLCEVFLTHCDVLLLFDA